jgi:hypothetical protein
MNIRWHLPCPRCKLTFALPDYVQLQIEIPRDDDLQPLTRRDMRREKCKICAILSTQSILLMGLLGVVVWGYVKIIMGLI